MKYLNKLTPHSKHTVVGGEHFFTLTIRGKDVATGALKMRSDNAAEITSLVVWNENERNKGYGKQVVLDIISFCKVQRKKIIKVKSSPEAMGFYQKLGFYQDDSKFLILSLE